MTTEIEVVESLMGNGKTFATLRYIEQQVIDNKESRWIYCTEYLSEIENRTKDDKSLCKHLWRTPTEDDKAQKFIELLLEPKVQLIAITHALLLLASKSTYINTLIKSKGYNLFLDETIELINPYMGCLYGDFLTWKAEDKFRIIEPNGKIEWVYKDEISGGLVTSFKQLADDTTTKDIHCSITGKSVALVEVENEIIITQFNRVILATYQLQHSLFDAYLSLKGIKKKPCKDIECNKSCTKLDIKSLITIDKRHNKKFKGRSMSSTWWEGHGRTGSTLEDIKAVSNTIRNIGDAHGCKGQPHLLGFTVPSTKIGKSSNPRNVYPRGYPSTVCFMEESNTEFDSNGKPKLVSTNEKDKANSTYIPCNSRACEDYKNKVVMVHAFNRFPQQQVSMFLSNRNIAFSSEVFALNELLQWLWRSAIRDNKPIVVCILSERMLELFVNWLEEPQD